MNAPPPGPCRNASCYFCLSVFAVREITEWIDRGATAVCPRCGVDAVARGALSSDKLHDLHRRWFGTNFLVILPPG